MLRRTLPVRRLAVAAVLPLALTTLAACGDDEGSTTRDAGGEPPTSATPTAEQPAGGEEIEPAAFMDAYEKAFAGTAHLSMTSTGGMGVAGEGDADFSKTPPAMAMTMSGPGAGETIVVDGAMYIQTPTTGEKYLRLDIDSSNPMAANLASQMDPRAMIENFEGAIESVVHEGQEQIDGRTVDSYAVTIDTAEMLERSGRTMTSGVELPDTVTYEMFLDEDGRFRRLSFELAGQGLTMDLTDWGKDVDIEAPPADQVTDMANQSGMPGASG